MIASFVVLGPPVPKARARACSDGRHRTPKATRAYERLVASIARFSIPIGWPMDGQYKLSVNFYFADHRRRDSDNCLKSIADALNKLAYDDDNQVTEICGRKVGGDPRPRAEVTVEYLGPMPTRKSVGAVLPKRRARKVA